MKYGLAILWDGPTKNEDENDAFTDAVRTMVSDALDDLNKALRKSGCPTGDFTIITKDEHDLEIQQ